MKKKNKSRTQWEYIDRDMTTKLHIEVLYKLWISTNRISYFLKVPSGNSLKPLALAWHKDRRGGYWKGKPHSKITTTTLLPLKKAFLGIWAWWGRPFGLGTSSDQPGRGGGKGDNIDVSVQKDDHVLSECQGMLEMLRTSCTHAVGYGAMCLLNTVTQSDCRLDPVYSMFQP